MTVQFNPYLSFRNDARAALEFYQSIFGGKLEISTFGSMGMGAASDADKVMHGHLTAPDVTLMASDTPSEMVLDGGTSMSLTLSGTDATALRTYWDALTVGGEITLPLGPAPWGGEFGMCTDRFGTAWMVSIDS